MTPRRAAALLLPFVLFAASACASRAAGGPTPAGAALVGRTFLSTAVTHAGSPKVLVGGGRITVAFTATEINADPGCNHLGGTYRADGNRIVVGELAQTDMGCLDGRGEQDAWFAGVLTAGPTWQLTGDTLTLTGPDDVITLVDRRVVDPDRPLTATTWAVDTLITGTTASSVPSGLSATLTVAGDGAFTLVTSCGQFTGRATVTPTTLVITQVTGPRLPCPSAAAALNSAIYSTLVGTVGYTIVGPRLTLTAADGSGLAAHAG